MERELALLTIITRQITANPLEAETPAARFKQIALMTMIVIEKLHVAGSNITLSQLVEMTGLARNALVQLIDPIVQRGLLVEEMGKTQWDAVQHGNSRSRPRYGTASLHSWALLLRNSNSSQMLPERLAHFPANKCRELGRDHSHPL